MTAQVKIYDNNGNPKGAYELKPSQIYDYGISTKYVFEFEYNQLNYDKNKKKGKNNKESIPYLMHKEMDIPILECQKAYDIAIEYLRSQGKVKG